MVAVVVVDVKVVSVAFNIFVVDLSGSSFHFLSSR